MSVTLSSMDSPVPEDPDVEMAEEEAQLLPLPELETVSVVEPAPPEYPHWMPSVLTEKHKKIRHYFATKASNAVILKDKLRRHIAWFQRKEKILGAFVSKRNLLRRLPARYVCCICAMGMYARDDEAPDDAVQEEAKKNNLMCERPLGSLEPFCLKKKRTPTEFADWWRKAEKNLKNYEMEHFGEEMKQLRMRSAFQAWKTKTKYVPPTTAQLLCSRSAIGTLDCKGALPAYQTGAEVCGRYFCKPCSRLFGFVNNLDDEKPSYCPLCYEEGTAADALEREKEEKLREASEKYRKERPNRELEYVDVDKTREPSRVVTDRSEDKWWVGSEAPGAQKLIKKKPATDGQYSGRELNVFLKAILNTMMNTFSTHQDEYTLVANDNPKHATLNVMECEHHFGEKAVKIVLESGYSVWDGKFIIDSELLDMDYRAKPDDPDEGDRDT